MRKAAALLLRYDGLTASADRLGHFVDDAFGAAASRRYLYAALLLLRFICKRAFAAGVSIQRTGAARIGSIRDRQLAGVYYGRRSCGLPWHSKQLLSVCGYYLGNKPVVDDRTQVHSVAQRSCVRRTW